MKQIVVLITLLLCAATINAQDDKQEKKPTPSSEMETFRLASQLAKYGYSNASALALIQAADLFATIGKQELGAESIEAGEGPSTSKDESISFEVEDLLKEAESLADGDNTYTDLIAKVRASHKTRGIVGGRRSGTFKVQAHATDVFRYKFYANSRATVIVSGDGDTDLDLYIYDANGNLITSDTDYSDDCVCTWTPAWTGSFSIKVKNRGKVYNRYTIVIE